MIVLCMRYIELNPLRANMVTHSGEYKWSSYAHNAQDKQSDIITSHPTPPHPLYL
jgi:putative transposase